MKLSLIVAHDVNLGIGKEGKLPWGYTIEEHEARLQALTHNKPIIMGRKTFEDMYSSKPFRGRTNIVITSDPMYYKKLSEKGLTIHTKDYCLLISHSYEDAVALAESMEYDEVFFLGGAKIFERALKDYNLTDLYITQVFHFFDCDKYFPRYRDNFSIEWQTVWSEHHPKEDWYDPVKEGPYSIAFYHIKRKPPGYFRRLSNRLKRK